MESQLNALLTDTDIWMVCPYDSRIARPDVLADALRTHPERLDGDRVAASPDYLDPARFRPPGPTAPPPGPTAPPPGPAPARACGWPARSASRSRSTRRSPAAPSAWS